MTDNTAPPEKLNGYYVLHQKAIDNDGSWRIIVHRPGCHDPFVVATWSRHSPNEWCWGHYFPNLIEAVEYFKQRSNK